MAGAAVRWKLGPRGQAGGRPAVVHGDALQRSWRRMAGVRTSGAGLRCGGYARGARVSPGEIELSAPVFEQADSSGGPFFARGR